MTRIANGENAEAVRRETGWHKGVDKKWRFEISDHDATLKQANWDNLSNALRIKRNDEKSYALGNLINHPRLFAAYPFLRTTRVFMRYGVGAEYQSDGEGMGHITVGMGDKDYLSAVLHEIQHSIQDREGFATGSSINGEIKSASNLLGGASPVKGKTLEQYAFDRYRKSAGEVEARNTQRRQGMTPTERMNESPIDSADVAPEDVIVVFNGKEMASAPLPANAMAEEPRGETSFDGNNPDIRYSRAEDALQSAYEIPNPNGRYSASRPIPDAALRTLRRAAASSLSDFAISADGFLMRGAKKVAF